MMSGLVELIPWHVGESTGGLSGIWLPKTPTQQSCRNAYLSYAALIMTRLILRISLASTHMTKTTYGGLGITEDGRQQRMVESLNCIVLRGL
jgi:hypothetical protein